MIKVQKVIITDISRKGTGSNEKSPVQAVTEIYTKKRDLIAFNDPLGNYSIEQMIEFASYCRQEDNTSIIELFRRWSGG